MSPFSFQSSSGTNQRNIDPAIITPSFAGLSLISRFLRTGIRKILPASVLLYDFWLGRSNTGHAALLIIAGVHHLIGAPGMGMRSWEWRGDLWSRSGGRPFWIDERTPRWLRWGDRLWRMIIASIALCWKNLKRSKSSIPNRSHSLCLLIGFCFSRRLEWRGGWLRDGHRC